MTVESQRAAAPPIVLAATLGLAAACWAAAAWLMNGMDMGVATRPGAFGFFAAAWVTMMTAMMLPGMAPAVARHARMTGKVRAALPFTGSYLAVWVLAGVVAYALDQPHGSLAAGAVMIAAGAYEFTPVKRHFRRRCREEAGSGLRFGLCCVGSSIGLMATLVALDVMNLFWMPVVAVLACAQKLLPAKAAIDVPLALALIGLGFVIVFAPSLVPGLTPRLLPPEPTKRRSCPGIRRWRRGKAGPVTGGHEPAGGDVPFDTSRPHLARVYDFWLGGKDNYAADEGDGRDGVAVRQ